MRLTLISRAKRTKQPRETGYPEATPESYLPNTRYSGDQLPPEPPLVRVKVFHETKLCHSSSLLTHLEIGRQRPGEQSPVSFDASQNRLVIAPLEEKLVSRQHLRLQIIHEATPLLEITNLSKKRSIWINTNQRIPPGDSHQQTLPSLISFEGFSVRVEASSLADSSWEIQSLDHPTLPPGSDPHARQSFVSRSFSQLAEQSLVPDSAGDLDPHRLIRWLSTTMEVLQSASGNSDFMQQAAESARHIVGLDEVLSLAFDGQQWTVAAQSTSGDFHQPHSQPSKTALERVLQLKRTIRRVPQHSGAHSLQGINALVVAPILNTDGDVIGALYGIRNQSSTTGPQITELEATMVEVLACGAAAGIARESQQRKAIEAQVRFEQFFTSELAKELEANPQLLDTQEAEISVLFCDIAGFSAIAATLSPTQTMRWIQAVMDQLSDVILKHDGVLVDYIGDELMAMWGAPKSQSNHSQLACLAAEKLLGCREAINAHWLQRIGQPTDIRIGIASGQASVGNTGSTKKFKYGPLGDTVNLASRLQGASKFLGVHSLVNQLAATHQGEHPLTFRPLGSVKLAGMTQPVDIFQPLPRTNKNIQLVEGWEVILETIRGSADPKKRRAIESGSTESKLREIAAAFPDDQPTKRLLERIRSAAQEITPDVLWRFDHK